MGHIKGVRKDGLEEAPGSPGIVREMAFRADGCAVIRSRVEPGVRSGWHHHGDHDIFGFMVSGTARFENGPGGRDAVTVSPGEFFHVPARTVHRDVNPSPHEPQEVILFLRGTGPMVVNVDGPDPA